MEKYSICFLFILNSFLGAAGENKYPVSSIPEELKSNVNAVIREDHMKFTILSKNSARHYVHYVVTILNEKGNGYAKHRIGYDKLIKVTDVSGTVYDANGTQVKRLKNKDIFDRASIDGSTLFSDNRIKSMDLSQATYPYTVEFEYELEYKYLYSIPGSTFGGTKSSTQHASYELVFPPDLTPRYKVLNMENNPKIFYIDGKKSITWTIENLKPFTFEKFGPDSENILPQIIATASKFEYEGYEGNVSSWKDFGNWFWLLNKDRLDIPMGTKQIINDLTKSSTTIEDKVKLVYEYLQSKTRYVNISLGIGGLQSFPASTVDQNGYGDCKALSTYTIALLKSIGINSYYSLIQAGESESELLTDFPSHQFNHVLVAVPNGIDTLWLECTSQTNPFGYQGTFTEDRWALMITDDGGKLVRTINYTPEQNLQSRSAAVTIDMVGNAKAKIKTTAKGIQYENDDLNWVLNNTERQKKWVEENTQIPNFNINSFSMLEKKERIPSVVIDLHLTLSRYASVSGKRLFVLPNLMNRISSVPEKNAERKTEIVRRTNYLDLDTIQISVPENLYPEFLPETVKINSKFGEYEASFTFDAGKVTYIRRMKVWKGRFPKETYNELVEFYKNVSKADNIKLVFLNKT